MDGEMYNTVFVFLIGILVFGYVLGRILDTLNLRHAVPVLPDELSDIFDPDEYRKSQLYKRDNTRFSFFSSSLGLALMLILFFTGGFGWLDKLVANLGLSYIPHVLCWRNAMASIVPPSEPLSWINSRDGLWLPCWEEDSWPWSPGSTC